MFAGTSYLGATGITPDSSGDTNSTIATIGNVLGQGLQLYGQLKLMDTNLKLAQQGRPPIDISQVSPQVNIGLAPEVKNALVVTGIAAAAGALLLFFLMRK
ncbi:MAG: hypothetical protein KGJ13_05005 [Patescibacteria group bacterium]|nr:hypothetical protein [Patescibacteria group bacterium]